MATLNSKKHFKMILSLFILIFLWVSWVTSMKLVTEKEGQKRRVQTFTMNKIIYPSSSSFKKTSSQDFKGEVSSAKIIFFKKKVGYVLKNGDNFLALSLAERPLRSPKVSKDKVTYDLASFKAQFELKKGGVKASYIFGKE